jgi:hypothetical protein
MQVMIQTGNGSMQPYTNTRLAYTDNNSLIVHDGTGETEVDGQIMNVSDPDVVSISDYHGSEVSHIKPSDIYAIDNEAVSLYCNEAMQVSNRVTIKFDSNREVEVSGKIIGCRMLE